MEWYSYFPSIVYREEHPEWVEQTLQAVQKYYDNCASNQPLAQTEFLGHDPALKFLADYLLEKSVEILVGQGYNLDNYELYASGLWGQGIKSNIGTNVHVHKNSQICGWFFLETPTGGSYPIYHDPRINKQMVELDSVQGPELTNASAHVHFNNVVPGTFLFSNSWMQHQLTQNMAKESTKAIHFIISHKDKAHACSM